VAEAVSKTMVYIQLGLVKRDKLCQKRKRWLLVCGFARYI
jgi:hypothetical protein